MPVRPLRILLVDDYEDTREIVAFILRVHGVDVEAVANKADALAPFRAGQFDLLVGDLWLPGGSGLDLMRESAAI